MRRNAGKLGNWKTALLYEYLTVIKEWNRFPSDFGICETDDNLNFMIAYERMTSKISDWERE